MLAAADTRANSIGITDDLVDQAAPIPGGADEMAMATMVRRNEVQRLQFVRQQRAGQLLTDAGMHRPVQFTPAEQFEQHGFHRPDPQGDLDRRTSRIAARETENIVDFVVAEFDIGSTE